MTPGRWRAKMLWAFSFALFRQWFYAFERVGQAHAFVFEGAHGVVGEHFDTFDNGVRLEVFGHGVEACIVVGDTGNAPRGATTQVCPIS